MILCFYSYVININNSVTNNCVIRFHLNYTKHEKRGTYKLKSNDFSHKNPWHLHFQQPLSKSISTSNNLLYLLNCILTFYVREIGNSLSFLDYDYN